MMGGKLVRTVYPITEFGSFISEKELPGYATLPKHTFEQLETFILSNKSKKTDALELMGISHKRGAGKVITARNYVGIITMKDGTVIEILPKVYSKQSCESDNDKAAAQIKRLLVEMLKTLRISPYKSLQTSCVNIERMNLFEVFIRMFIDEIFRIVKHGLKRSYETVENNEQLFKGKIKFQEHIKYNFAHKERSYVEYDDYNSNRPENRLLKAALLYLYKKSASVRNKSDLRTLLNEFCEVDASTDYEGDYASIIPDRNMKDYEAALLWCRVLLMGKSFTSFSGSEVAVALLFPMETLFESYIAARLSRVLENDEFSVSVQDKTYYLFDKPDKKFLIKPDIVINRKADNVVFILDTKWKVLSEVKSTMELPKEICTRCLHTRKNMVQKMLHCCIH
ncbi:mcrBC 5-methylcytosine restriction system component [Lachnospiraceae bacterium]|nr:mcrBC 5-methylcytosine restriction system component [Lachnospiraceae bacterium]